MYGVDLRDVLIPEARLTPLWVLTLIKGLPDSSRFVAERRGGPQFRGWDIKAYAAAATVNAVRALQYTYISANSKSRPKAPLMFPVPDQSVKKSYNPNSFAAIAASKMAASREGSQ